MPETSQKSARKAVSRKSAETIRKYMDEAETLFIRLGYEATSIRAISSRAKMNLSTVVYHWGTKEALFREVCLRLFSGIVAEQLRRLKLCAAQIEALSPDDLPVVLRALVEPPLLMPQETDMAERTRLLYGRVLTDPSPVALQVTTEIFGEATELFRSLVRRCLDHLDEETFHWRYVCAVGSFVIAQSFERKFSYALGLSEVEPDWTSVSNEIVQSMAATLARK
ncbi:TetR/AcrR family transcriptional regulator [Altericroceibacterium xinjiangense]|uniref:TetR/AcrR family transcriptional regulator n=1 Tax=Altericroceibacterium xinjiangense TaxID=762261 RepID=UPI000F7F0836|nr:TetR/AcrR family transcriptional regulator [Altericroceibacterium xinjiangense]